MLDVWGECEIRRFGIFVDVFVSTELEVIQE
jgi:hypothetical protein